MDSNCENILISVIIPAYNAEKYISETIESVIAQTYTNWELLVIDDGSTDATTDIVRSFAGRDERIHLYINEKNMGVARTRNRGFDLARGEYIALLDSDDVWLSEKLARQLSLAQQTGAEIIYCSYGLINGNGDKAGRDFIVPSRTDFEQMLTRCVFSCSTNIFLKDVCKKHHFDEEYYHEDYVLWLELLRQGYTAVGCTEVLAQYRQIVSSRSANKVKAAKHRWTIYRRYLGMPLIKCISCFVKYAFAGIAKYC